MYVIGTSESDLIRIISDLFVSCDMSYSEISKVVYNTKKYTMFSNLEEATEVLNEIKERKEEIEFENGSVVGAVLDKDKVFDVNNLKVYELYTVEANEKIPCTRNVLSKYKKEMTGAVYRHFKGDQYQVLDVAVHTETGSILVIYQRINCNGMTYACPIEVFLSKVDKEKYPNVKQEMRFMRVN